MIPLLPGENIRKQERCNFLKSSIEQLCGTVFLTDKRLVFEREQISQFKVLSLFAREHKKKILVDIELKTIKSVEESTHGIHRNFLLLISDDFPGGLRFALGKSVETWVQELHLVMIDFAQLRP